MKYLNQLVVFLVFVFLSCSNETPIGVDSQNTSLNSDNLVSLAKKNKKKKKGKIVFNSDRDGNQEIYVMNADGSGQTRLTNNPADDERSDWSPNGRKIVFVSTRDGNEEIYVMNADGSGQTNLTNNPTGDRNPSWSPNGKKIAFQRGGIYVMNADGSGQTQLTDGGGHPSWSPNGKKIAFHRGHGGGQDIYVMNADGSGQIRLTNDPARDKQPSWSPNGRKIAFMSERDGNREIYVMNADGTEQIRLTTDGGAHPDWSPDGRKIAFDSNGEIYVMNADGSGQTNLTNNQFGDERPDWARGRCKICREEEDDADWTKNPANRHFYRLTEPMSWTDAEAQAQEWGGHLVMLNRWEEELWIKNTFGENEYFWIGMNDIEEEGNWVWSSGKPVAYTNWAEGEPNDFRGEDAAVMNWDVCDVDLGEDCFGDFWNDLAIEAHYRGVVEKKRF